MKKVLSYILISFILFANLFAPLSVGLSERNKIEVKNNKAEAYDWFGSDALDGTDESPIKLQINPSVKDREIRFDVSVKWGANSLFTTTTFEIKRHLDDTGKNFETKAPRMGPAFATAQTGYVVFDGLEPETTYKFDVYLYNEHMDYTQTLSNLVSLGIGMDSTTGSLKNNVPYQVTTLKEITGGYTQFVKQGGEQIQNDASLKETMPACGIDGLSNNDGTVMGCVAQFVYYAVFVPTSYFFALSGVFFDNTFAYSVQDSSYRSSFVVQGWGLVRDFCNMFFIFILLYVAIGTTLGLHGINTKGTIINIVIIGLFINFSLFATQVIIDASNVTARVFYNSDTIKVTVKGQTDNTLANATNGGSILAEEKDGGVINLSEALVNKVNPQNIIINAKKVNSIPVKGGGDSVIDDQESNIGAGTFILITLMAVGINVVGIIVFLSVGLIFVSRVIGLWLAMILSPLAFFTYILPSMSSTKMIGWKKWWPETLELAFLAPVFMFFLYIILKFLELDLISDPMSKDGLSFFIATLIPFAFIMILMMKAKGIAKDMSGEIGQQITGGISTIGGMALGGAALGAAALGRGLIANPMKMMKSDSTRNAALKNFNMLKPSTYGKAASAGLAHIGLKTQAGVAIQKKMTGYGKEIGEKSHAEHVLNEQAEKISAGSKFSDLDSGQQARAKTAASKIEIARTLYKKDADKLTTDEARDVESYIDTDGEVKGVNKDRLRQSMVNVTNNVAQLLDQAAQAAHGMSFNQLQATNPAASKNIIDQVTKLDKFHDAGHLEDKYNTKTQDFMGIGKTISSIPKSSFDVRNAKMSGLMAPLGLMMKTSLSSLGMNAGKAQGDFMKDLSKTLEDSIAGLSKTMKIDVKVDAGHGGGGHDDHGGGDHKKDAGHGGGGGGHH